MPTNKVMTKSTKDRKAAQVISGKAVKTAAKSATTTGEDVIKLILEDHKPLKKLIKVMKDAEKDLSARQAAFKEFAPLLIAHAKPEEATVYADMKSVEDLRVEGCEGDAEHAIADQLVKEIKHEQDEDVWSAKVKVLAELVEHHIEEEEEEQFPDFKKRVDAKERAVLGARYAELRKQYLVN